MTDDKDRWMTDIIFAKVSRKPFFFVDKSPNPRPLECVHHVSTISISHSWEDNHWQMAARNHRIRVITARKRVIAFVIEDSRRAALKLRRNTRTKKFIAIFAVKLHVKRFRFIFNAPPEDIEIFFLLFLKQLPLEMFFIFQIEIFVNCILRFLVKRYRNNCVRVLLFFFCFVILKLGQVRLDFLKSLFF